MLNAIAATIAEYLSQHNLSSLEPFDQMNRCVRWAIISYMAGIPRAELDLIRIEVFYQVTASLIVSLCRASN